MVSAPALRRSARTNAGDSVTMSSPRSAKAGMLAFALQRFVPLHDDDLIGKARVDKSARR